jgi:hypothetical protein
LGAECVAVDPFDVGIVHRERRPPLRPSPVAAYIQETSKTDNPGRSPCKKSCPRKVHTHSTDGSVRSVGKLGSEILDRRSSHKSNTAVSLPFTFYILVCTFSVRSATLDQLYISLSSSLNLLGSTFLKRVICRALDMAIIRSIIQKRVRT